jgi:hypothetical protein
MTFLEAAIEVLRDADEPLHFSEIARRAVDRKLLSHVGRDPEAAMRGCLTSAVRGQPDDALIHRTKPAHYAIKPGADLPERPEPKKKAKKKSAKKSSKKATKKAAKKTTKKAAKKKSSKRSSEVAAADAPEPEAEAPAEPVPEIEFEAPTGSGLSGPTDVALVMANAMSRLADERPELKSELEAMQASGGEEGAESAAGPSANGPAREGEEGPVVERRTHRGRTRPDGDEGEERGGRRRRRRRRRTKKLEWSAATESTDRPDAALLDAAASVLASGSRSLHVRQIAEQLAAKNLLGGDISELERAVTSAIVLDVHRLGEGSRFDIRGDARYQLRGGRVPEGAAKSETALYAAARKAEGATRTHLRAWLGSLGARGFESLVRIYLDTEGYRMASSLPPVRGLGRLVVHDPDPEFGGRVLVLAVPAKTAVERKLWEGDLERHDCRSVLVLAAGENAAGDWGSDVRLLPAPWFAQWLMRKRVGVRSVTLTVPVLDPSVIESVGGLDT